MRYAIKASDGSYVRHSVGDISAVELEAADLFAFETSAKQWIKAYAFGKWLDAKVVPVQLIDLSDALAVYRDFA